MMTEKNFMSFSTATSVILPVWRKPLLFLFTIVFTFSGTSLSGGYSNAAFSGRFTESSILRLKNIEKIVKNTKITNLDYEKLLAEEGNSVFIF